MAFTPTAWAPHQFQVIENNFNSVKISLASPIQIRRWSHGEVTKAETINYRSQKPEKDGLFCERIFGPTRDYECYCGRYKRHRDRQRRQTVTCESCGVEVTRSNVRRERMGHIELADPVAHIWFAKGMPSRMSMIMDIAPRELEKVLYFSAYIVTDVDEEERQKVIDTYEQYRVEEMTRFEEERDIEVAEGRADSFLSNLMMSISDLRARLEPREKEPEAKQKATMDEVIDLKMAYFRVLFELDIQRRIERVNDISVKMTLNETRYHDLKDEFGEVFQAGMGAEAVRRLLEETDLHEIKEELTARIRESSGQKRTKAIKRLSVVEAFIKSGNRPEWMVLTVLPVLPPELHPMVQLDGGRYATSDLNDLYRRVINRNNRLKHLKKLSAPQIILRNERRMLQEAVDALIDNGRRGRPIMGRHNHKLKSLTDLLRGKQGRFRQNLLGKRVDYSGRSVIISGPDLKLDECGIPKQMALELFKPFVMHKLMAEGHAHNIKTAKRRTEEADATVWDVLERVVKGHPVLLNRAPTLHRLGIQAFYPRLVEGSAIQLHPLVCTAFNADFDGDQMAVHVPLSEGAKNEAERLMLSTRNMLAPRSGAPIVTPSLDMLLGIYYLTGPEVGQDRLASADIELHVNGTHAAENGEAPPQNGKRNGKANGAAPRFFRSTHEANQAYQAGDLHLRDPMYVRMDAGTVVRAAVDQSETLEETAWFKSTVGRVIFNEILPPEMGYFNCVLREDDVEAIVKECFELNRHDGTSDVLDAMKTLGFEYATRSGTTIAIKDAVPPPEKGELISQGRALAQMLADQFNDGLITDEERYQATIDAWIEVSDNVTDAVKKRLEEYNGVFTMSDSGAKGNLQQIRQMAGMRGLMTAPNKQWSTEASIIETPVVSSLAEGLTVHEYFASTHGSRKALTDTALKTAEAGYLTRRMSDAAQDVIINAQDCGANVGIWIRRDSSIALNVPFEERIAGRYSVRDIVDPETGEVLATTDDMVQTRLATRIAASSLDEVEMRSSVGCTLARGVCAKCYGEMLANSRPSIIGEAVGIVAAQSIGEPGTQLTMRNFHTGGTATDRDITTGLPRVQELFEARVPKSPAILSEIAGTVERREDDGQELIVVQASKTHSQTLSVADGYKKTVEDGAWVDAGTPVAELTTRGRQAATDKDGEIALPDYIFAPSTGSVIVDGDKLTIEWTDDDEKAYIVPLNGEVLVSEGDEVQPGDQLTGGQRNPHDILETQGIPEVRNYLVDEAQRVYRSQGVKVHDKHFEVIVRQMLSKVKIVSAGDTNLLIDDVVDRREFESLNEDVRLDGGATAEAKPVLLGISRVALMSQSFLARASFQETERVLTEAALKGSVDRLNGLKENVIIGRMIPARLDKSAVGREILGLPSTFTQPALPGTDLAEDWKSALEAVAADESPTYAVADPANFATVADSNTPVGFKDDDDDEFDPDASAGVVGFVDDGGFERSAETTVTFADDD